MNEMFLMSQKIGIDWESIMDGFISDGRIGNSHIDVPGHDGDLGFGGKCFPKDLNAFIEFFVENDVDPFVLTSAWKRNKSVRTDIDWANIMGAVSEENK
jgi:UDPglucose 6-dehydrogenase